jgi:hypothetical protein
VNKQNLQAELSRFERIFKIRVPAASGLARALRDIYATKSAYAVLSCVRMLYPDEVETARNLAKGDESSLRPSLPGLDAVQSAAPRLLESIHLQDRDGAVRALGDMGVLALCPSPELLFSRLEFSAGLVGPARLIALTELAIVAAELGFCERASVYVASAHALAPGAPELHDLHTVAGVIALNAGKITEAKEHLSDSIRVCERNEFACLACSIRAFSVLLAGKLLDHGEAGAVVEYLSRCQGVWKHEAKRLASWIEAIRSGEKPDFLASGFRNAMESPVVKMRALPIRSSFLPAPHEVDSEKPIRETRARLDEMREDYRRRIAAAVKGKLETGRN